MICTVLYALDPTGAHFLLAVKPRCKWRRLLMLFLSRGGACRGASRWFNKGSKCFGLSCAEFWHAFYSLHVRGTLRSFSRYQHSCSAECLASSKASTSVDHPYAKSWRARCCLYTPFNTFGVFFGFSSAGLCLLTLMAPRTARTRGRSQEKKKE